MIAAWIVYCALCALGLAAAATLAERVLLAARGPVRAVWFAAVLLSLLIPAVALTHALHARPPVLPSAQTIAISTSSAPSILPTAPVPILTAPASGAGAIAPRPSRFVRVFEVAKAARARWTALPLLLLVHADRPLAYLWLALSTLLGLYFVAGVGALAVMRRSWRRDVVLDVPVFVSGRIGPAVVGMLSPAIVLPQWALAMDAARLALMLRHEQEHRRARDSQLLTLAHAALVVMPWNLALWWQIRRLRAAVELDCDARVLQHADVRSYGDLLLEVVRPGHQLRLMGATAFAERATQLERRIRVMALRRRRAANAARAMALSIALSALSVAWIAPRPAMPIAMPMRPVPRPQATTLHTPATGLLVRTLASADAAPPPVAPRAAASTVLPPAGAGGRESNPAAVDELSAADAESFLRDGTFGILNPMLGLLRNSESLGLTARQADSLATLNRWYMVQLSGIWSPVERYYAAARRGAPVPPVGASRAPEASMNALIALVPGIRTLLTEDQRRRLPADIAADLDVARLAALGAGRPEVGSVFARNGGLGSGPGARGRRGGPAR